MTRQVTSKEQKVIDKFAARPWETALPEYYPPIDKFSSILHKLRYHGLYRDEHLDFTYEIKRLRKERGKGPPAKGEGKRAKNRKT